MSHYLALQLYWFKAKIILKQQNITLVRKALLLDFPPLPVAVTKTTKSNQSTSLNSVEVAFCIIHDKELMNI